VPLVTGTRIRVLTLVVIPDTQLRLTRDIVRLLVQDRFRLLSVFRIDPGRRPHRCAIGTYGRSAAPV